MRVGALLDDALDRGDVDAVCKLAREYRATVESYGKIAGWTADGSGSTTIINDNRRVMAVLGKMSDDEIRAALLGAETPELDAAIEASSPPILPP